MPPPSTPHETSTDPMMPKPPPTPDEAPRTPGSRAAKTEPCPRALLIGSCCAAACVGVEYGIIYPTMYSYLKSLGGRPALLMGVASAAFSLTKTVGFVPFGALADRVGPRIPCTLLFMVACMGNLYYYAAKSPRDVVAARAIVGVGSSVTGILMAVVAAGDAADAAARARRDRNLALFNGTSLLALLLGPGLAAVFAYAPTPPASAGPAWCEFDQYDAPGLFLACLTACCALWCFVCLPREPYSKTAADDDDVAPPPKPFARHHATAALVGRRGFTSLVVAFVGGALIATLDTAFPVVAKDDFDATVTTISVVLAMFAIAGVFAMVVSGAYAKLGGPDEKAARRKIYILRFCVASEIAGGIVGLSVFQGLPTVELAAVGCVVGSLVVLGALGGSNANVQLLAGVADMRRHPGFYSGLRSVAVCAGRATGGLLSGFLLDLDPSPTHTSTFASVVGFAALSLVPVFFFPPRVVPLEPAAPDDRAAPLLSTRSDAASEPPSPGSSNSPRSPNNALP